MVVVCPFYPIHMISYTYFLNLSIDYNSRYSASIWNGGRYRVCIVCIVLTVKSRSRDQNVRDQAHENLNDGIDKDLQDLKD